MDPALPDVPGVPPVPAPPAPTGEAPPPPRPGPPAVEIAHLWKSFEGKLAVEDLSLSVAEGEFFGFLGPNGAGKSTTIKLMCGLLKPDRGDIRVLGLDVFSMPLEVRRRIGILPEETTTYERLTAVELLSFVGRLHGLSRDEVARRSAPLLDLMEIAAVDRGKMILDFSMGMRKKVQLACALIHGPRLLFLDEPFNGIDAVTVRAIRQVLQDAVRRGVTIFFSSHILELVEKLCTRIAIITRGRLRVCGTVAEAKAAAGMPEAASLEDLFVHLAGGERTTSAALEFLG